MINESYIERHKRNYKRFGKIKHNATHLEQIIAINVNYKDDEGKLICKTRNKKIALPITYRIVKNINQKSPKYGQWSLYYSVNVQDQTIITDIGLGTIGIDLNQNHLAVSEIDAQGNLIQSVNIHLNGATYSQDDTDDWKTKQIKWINSNNGQVEYVPIKANDFKFAEKINSSEYDFNNLSADKAQIVLGKALTIITNWAQRVGKPMVIEKLDFTQKKRDLKATSQWIKNQKTHHQVKNKSFNYNRMISSFAYNKFKEILRNQCARKGVELKEVNPAFSSLIGMVNHGKRLGLSIHMAASYVMAKRGLIKKTKFYSFNDLLENVNFNNDISDNRINDDNINNNINDKQQNNSDKNIKIHFQGQIHLIEINTDKSVSCTVSNSKVGDLSQAWKMVQETCQQFKKAYFQQKALEKKLVKPSSAPAYAVDPFTGDQVPNLIPYIPGIQCNDHKACSLVADYK